ncbi:hypothetical protein A2Z67_02565 [Candidatus Woesebacteria bacterium RBG_13_36_22]|uniref:Uncharacterized protein n=1 Tax=Candidatus Woesebacteria bacterium RBG_13_36_22 TaxID=1802478 RepID=A0A1F7X3B1_9BACT|nr:MAG: hypothetical protein A2Z67_02565 [Candidatus Woesebacteria bacterium RBG_13_36_22]
MKTDTVDPARLSTGHWDHNTNKQIDEGDIGRSYSADVIASDSAFRKPFKWKDGWRISVGSVSIGLKIESVKTYRLVPFNTYEGEKFTYEESHNLDDNHVSRFSYEGMIVKKGKEQYILTELLILISDEKKIETTKQLTLF